MEGIGEASRRAHANPRQFSPPQVVVARKHSSSPDESRPLRSTRCPEVDLLILSEAHFYNKKNLGIGTDITR